MYREAVAVMVDSLNSHTRVPGGFASIRSVLSMEQVRMKLPRKRFEKVNLSSSSEEHLCQVPEAWTGIP